jgi:hypothetical protein
MSYNIKKYDRNQAFLIAPRMNDWLPKEHLVWFLIDFVEGSSE